MNFDMSVKFLLNPQRNSDDAILLKSNTIFTIEYIGQPDQVSFIWSLLKRNADDADAQERGFSRIF